LTDVWKRSPVRVVPDWICEILSPSDERRDRVHKAALYARAGVGHYWMLAPAERILEAFELRAGAWVRLGAWGGGGAGVRIQPFAEIEIEIERLFPPE
jgi:Uma2 family endonuclease